MGPVRIGSAYSLVETRLKPTEETISISYCG
jgi:hypothetical protein